VSRFERRCRDFVPQNSLLLQCLRLSVLCAIAFALIPNAPAQAGSVKATMQVRARIISSCRISADSLQSAVNRTHGRFNCQANGQTAASAPAYRESANYTLSDAPGSNGTVKILTLNF